MRLYDLKNSVISIVIMKERMDQAEIDALLKDSMFEDSEIRQSAANVAVKTVKDSEADEYGDEFESYDESRRTFKNASKTEFDESRKFPPKNKLEAIKEEVLPVRNDAKENRANENKRPKSGIYFQPKGQKQTSTSREKKNLPYNYARISERQRQLLLTSITQENLELKESLRLKDNEYKKLDGAYKALLKEKSVAAPSVKEATLQRQLAALQSKYQKLQQLCKLQKSKNTFKASKTQENFIPENKASQRQEQLCDIIEQLRERLMATTNQLKTLQNKMNQGENYVDELRRKLRRIQQLQYKMQKMTEQAENDRSFIQMLKDKNRKLEDELKDLQRQKKMLQIQVHRLKLGDSTQKDCFSQLQQIRKEKEVLQRNLRELTSNLMTKVRTNYVPIRIEDSGQLLKY